MNNKVSIITPVYNSERFIADCIKSVQSQTYSDWEHILVDDCSSDLSASTIKEFSRYDKRIKYFKLSSNSGAGVARNAGIEYAKGRYIAFLDSDDFWREDKLEKQVGLIIQNSYAFVYSQYYIVGNDNVPMSIVKSPKKVNFNKMLCNDYIGCLTVVYDSKVLGKQYMPTIRKRQDWVLWLKLLKKVDNAFCVQEPLAYYRVGNATLSKNKFKLIKHNFNVYYKQLDFPYVISFILMINFLIHYFYFKKTSIKKLG